MVLVVLGLLPSNRLQKIREWKGSTTLTNLAERRRKLPSHFVSHVVCITCYPVDTFERAQPGQLPFGQLPGSKYGTLNSFAKVEFAIQRLPKLPVAHGSHGRTG